MPCHEVEVRSHPVLCTLAGRYCLIQTLRRSRVNPPLEWGISRMA